MRRKITRPFALGVLSALMLSACGGGPAAVTPRPDFTLTADASLSLVRGAGGKLNVTLHCAGDEGWVGLNFDGLPDGVSSDTTDARCGITTPVELWAGSEASPGDFTPKLTATGGSMSHTVAFKLRVLNAPGSLDTAFGAGGVVTTALPEGNAVASALVVQPDGKLVVVGSAASTGRGIDFLLARYTTNGALDPSFGQGGIVTTDFAGKDDDAMAVTLQSDGKLVVAGHTGTDFTGDGQPDHDTAVARYNPDGTLDATFGTGGKTVTPLSAQRDGARAVTVRRDGKIVVAGSSNGGAAMTSGDDFALERLNADGSVDTSFGQGGKVTTDFGGLRDVGYALVAQGNGKVVVGGFANIPVPGGYRYRFALARYHEDGTLDNSFGEGGKVMTVVGQDYGAVQVMTLQPDGKIVVAGTGVTSLPNRTGGSSTYDFALARYNTDGSLDSGFNQGQPVLTDLRGSNRPLAKVTAGGRDRGCRVQRAG